MLAQKVHNKSTYENKYCYNKLSLSKKIMFLHHLLMSFSKLEYGNQLFWDNNMKKAFINIVLFDEENPLVSKDNLIRKIILHQFI